MKRKLSFSVLALIFSGVTLVTPLSWVVHAQGQPNQEIIVQVEEEGGAIEGIPEGQPVEEVEETEETILSQPSNQVELEALRDTYRAQLEAYRDQERQHLIAKEQYNQLKTLTALETAVNTTRQVLITRAEVLDTYVTMLRLTLQDQPGVEVSRKEKLLIELDSLRVSLAQHKAQVEQATERTALAQVAQDFIPLGKSIESKSYHVQSAITLGRLQTVFDKSLALSGRLKEHALTDASSIQQSRRERAFAETERTVENIRQQLISSELEVQKEEGHSRSQYARFSTTLNPIYANLSQLLSYLEEVLTL